FDLVLGPSLHRLPPQQPHLLHDPLLDRIGLLEVSLAVLYRPNYRRESIAKTRVRLETDQNRLVAECSGCHLLNSHPFPNPNLTPHHFESHPLGGASSAPTPCSPCASPVSTATGTPIGASAAKTARPQIKTAPPYHKNLQHDCITLDRTRPRAARSPKRPKPSPSFPTFFDEEVERRRAGLGAGRSAREKRPGRGNAARPNNPVSQQARQPSLFPFLGTGGHRLESRHRATPMDDQDRRAAFEAVDQRSQVVLRFGEAGSLHRYAHMTASRPPST